jgi:outer membrane lipoprotein SlyB
MPPVCPQVQTQCRQEASLAAAQAKQENVQTQASHMGVGAAGGAVAGGVAGAATGPSYYGYRRSGLCIVHGIYGPRYVRCGGYGYGYGGVGNTVARGAAGAAGGAAIGALIGLGTSQFSMKDLQREFDASFAACIQQHMRECSPHRLRDADPPLSAEHPR